MEKKKVEISVIIPTFRDWARLKTCLEAIEKQDASTPSYEVIVVNNDPLDTPPEDFFLPKGFLMIDESNPGSYAARNAALKVAQGTILAFTDSDCIPGSDWLLNGTNHLKRGVDRVAGRVELFFKGDRLSWAEVYEKAFAFRQKKNAAKGVSVTANLFTWRVVMDEVGHFDDHLMSGGDIEWNRRATAMGKTIAFGEDCAVYHPARCTVDELVGKKKRVTGGMHSINGFDKSRLWRGLFPPVKTLPELMENKSLNAREIAVAFLVYYYLKVYAIYLFSKLELRIEKPSRV
ncbi:glycosyltransferase family 2 protein [Halomonas heilongjiangensis]|uniref:Glycosyltransferase family 2 protein n=1 Tax=Halomonas heilongjiangensis TaxID=1387883 RepID=A0A2N7TUL4_9GAMM|nr:glycosyltransferase [Halomonas heilongjiangensis]PMR71871.1 glycosyltransferase family 2 protein [Halomonas heilongjiangensis]PXX87665.1 hypothetical protein CR158_17840 [Halomonas heilongjiangensis]